MTRNGRIREDVAVLSELGDRGPIEVGLAESLNRVGAGTWSPKDLSLGNPVVSVHNRYVPCGRVVPSHAR